MVAFAAFAKGNCGGGVSGIVLQAKCEDCAALCCVLLAFDAGKAFGFDKAAMEPCRNLTAGNKCRGHGTLAQDGFGGCVAFDCHGAGQRVVQEVFGGLSWRDDPGLMPAMEAAFRGMRRLHEAVVLLEAAAGLGLSGAQEAERQAVLAGLEAERRRDVAELVAFEGGAALAAVPVYLATLRGAVRPRHR